MRLKQVLLIAIIAIMFGACEDDFSPIGGGILPANDHIITNIDQNKIDAVNEQSGPISSANPSSFILGEISDATFGTAKADFLTQLSVGELDANSNKLGINADYILDSTKLMLKFTPNEVIGNAKAEHNISVYELNTDLSQLTNYKSDFDISNIATATSIGDITFSARNNKNDSIWNIQGYVDTLNIIIPPKADLSDIGNRLFLADSAIVVNNDTLKKVFKGLYITSKLTTPGNEGSLIKFNPRNLAQELVLYYKYYVRDKNSNKVTDTIHTRKVFPVNIESVKINRFKHSNAKIPFDDKNADRLYVQAMAGSQAKLQISDSFVDNWKQKLDKANTEHNGIAAVDMSFYIDTTATNYRNYAPPQVLAIYRKDPITGKFITPDFENHSGATLAGINTATLVYKQNEKGVIYPSHYKFSFTPEYFDQFILPSDANKDNVKYRDLYIVPVNPKSNFNRVVLYSANNTIDKDKGIIPAYMAIKYVTLK